MSSIIVLGSINTDLIIHGPRLPAAGETVLEGRFSQAQGGKGANQAVAAARAGLDRVAFIAALGDDGFGATALASLRKENLNCDHVKTVPGTPTGVALILVDSQGENCISVASGANACLTAADVDAVPETLFSQSKVFLACMESPLAAVMRGLERAKQAGLTTILNPAPADLAILSGDLLKLVDVLTPNRAEAAMLAGQSVGGTASAIAAGRKLQSLGCRTVVVTLGAEGCVVLGEDTLILPALKVTAVDSTAAGDAFSGALAVALAEGRPFDRAVRFAAAAAGLSVTRHGAQPSLPGRREIELQI